MKSSRFILIGLIGLLLAGSVFASSYLYLSNQSLKNELSEYAEQTKTKTNSFSLLQKELNDLRVEMLEPPKMPTFTTIPNIETADEQPVEPSEKNVEEITETMNPTSSLIAVEPSRIDLGTISKANGIVKASYKITNKGNRRLKIYSTFSSCGCTTADLKNKTLEPGESLELTAEYDPNYFSGPLGLGSIEKRITIITNDTTNPFYKVYLKANVIP